MKAVGRPPKASERISGAFTFSLEDGIFLDIDGLLRRTGGPGYSLVLGRTNRDNEGSKYISVVCKSDKMTSRQDGTSLQRLRGLFAYVSGSNFIKSSSLFYKLEVQYTYLIDWIGLHDFSGPVEGIDGHLAFIPNYVLPKDELEAFTEEGCKVSVTIKEVEKGTDADKEKTPSAWITFSSSKAMSWETWYDRYVLPICDLISLAINKPNFIVAVHAYKSERDDAEVLFSAKNQKVRQASLQPRDAFFTLLNPDVLTELGSQVTAFKKIVESWLRIAHRSEQLMARALFFETLYSEEIAEQVRFLLLTQAAEAYHSALYDQDEVHQKELDDQDSDFLANVYNSDLSDETKTRLEIFLAGIKKRTPEEKKTLKTLTKEVNASKVISEQHKARLVGIINATRNESLSQRVQKLVVDLSDSMKELLDPYLDPERKMFGSRVSTLRNSLVHGSSIKGDSLRESYCLANVLSYTLRVLFFGLIGLPPTVCERLIYVNTSYRGAVVSVREWCKPTDPKGKQRSKLLRRIDADQQQLVR